jgi:hypothetical protein
MRAVEQLRARAEAHPLAAPELEPALAAIRRRYGFSVLAAQPVGEYWVVSATLGTQTSRRPVRIKRAPGAGAAPTASTPSLPEKVFEAGGERHRIYIVIHNGRAIPMISSEAQRVKEFLGAVPPRFADDEERANALKAAKRLADDVDRLANDLEDLIARNARASDIQAKRSDLGTHEMKLADQLHIALGGVNISKLDRGYLLEGVVGTYGTVPEQRRDRMTPDHQPQDSLMKYAAGLTIGSTRRKLFAGLRMGRYATNDGWAINLHHQRHVWGQTYGKPPQPMVINRLDAIAGGNQTEAVQQRAVIRVLRTAAEDDADQIEAALKNGDDHDVWSDLKRKIPGRDAKAIDDRNAMRDRIRDRVHQGEIRIRRQPLEDFLR